MTPPPRDARVIVADIAATKKALRAYEAERFDVGTQARIHSMKRQLASLEFELRAAEGQDRPS